MPGKDVCYHHGGASTGAPPENENAIKHALYTKRLRRSERDVFEAIPVETIDDELRIAKIQLDRALELQQLIEGEGDEIEVQGQESPTSAAGFELSEASLKTGSNSFGPINEEKIVKKRYDYRAHIDRCLARIGKLTQIRNEMKGDATPGDVTITVKHTRHDDD
jgi:hypothetical protein